MPSTLTEVRVEFSLGEVLVTNVGCVPFSLTYESHAAMLSRILSPREQVVLGGRGR